MAAIARKLGFSKQTFDAYLKGRIPRADDAQRIADGLGLDLREMLTGVRSEPREIFTADVVLVQRVDLKASAGHGRAVDAYDGRSSDRIAFTRDWLRRLNVEPQHAVLMTASGDSMHPTINDGDLILVNRAITTVETAGIYVVTIAGMVVVKRAYWQRDGSLVLKSDNSLYPEEVIPPDELYTVTIEGRVRWAARSM